jgi:hypothetical protein
MIGELVTSKKRNKMSNQVLKFGTEGIKGTTPPILKTIYRWLLAALAIWQVINITFPEINDVLASYVSRVLDIGVPILYAVSNAFGYVNQDTKSE